MSAKVEAKFVKRDINLFETSIQNLSTNLGGNTQRWSIDNLNQSNDLGDFDELESTLRLVSGVSSHFNLYLYIINFVTHSDYRGYLLQEFRFHQNSAAH